jgi:hypothetical protein
MDPVFLIVFGIGFLITVSIDIQTGKSLKKSSKIIVFTLNGMTAVLVVAASLGYNIPMPTQFFHEYVSPWVRIWLES